MTDLMIDVEGLSKAYSIASARQTNQSFREMLVSLVTSPLDRWRRLGGRKSQVFWALQHVTFSVRSGEVVGLIGHNGAGKSTLLKILSRITQPTDGVARIRGRVSSLLEVGTGFHPELTGRENVFLNGAILGMTRADIQQRFDEIVAFSEVEQFLDVPVKRYSSGMHLRLAFAVAAHLEPEVLLVDEVLAVGDAAFQQKCLGKMSEVASEGRTVLLTTHSLGAVRELCSRALVLQGGHLKFDGDAQEAIAQYLGSEVQGGAVVSTDKWAHRVGGDRARVVEMRFTTTSGTLADEFFVNEPIRISLRVRFEEPIDQPEVGFTIQTSLREPLFASVLSDTIRDQRIEPGLYEFTVVLDPCNLMPGRYVLVAAASRWHREGAMRGELEHLDWVENVPAFSIRPTSDQEESLRHRWGHLLNTYAWTQERIE